MWQDFKHAYYDIAVQHVSHCTIESSAPCGGKDGLKQEMGRMIRGERENKKKKASEQNKQRKCKNKNKKLEKIQRKKKKIQAKQ